MTMHARRRDVRAGEEWRGHRGAVRCGAPGSTSSGARRSKWSLACWGVPLLCALGAACQQGGASGWQVAPFDSAGTLVTPLDAVAPCDPCELTPELALRLGDADGPGMAEGEAPLLSYDAATDTYALVWLDGGARVGLYDAAGHYLRSIGRQGDGPGEFTRPPSRFVLRSGILTAVDPRSELWKVFDANGALVEERRLEIEPQTNWIFVSRDTVFMSRPSWVGPTPSPLVSFSSGELLGHVPYVIFERPDTFTAYGQVPTAAGRTPFTVATAWRDQLTVREWSLDGALLRVIRGEPPGYPPVNVRSAEEGEPFNLLNSFAFDRAGRLWLVGQVPAETWRENAAAMNELRGGATGPMEFSSAQLNSLPRRVAPRLDVFDLETGRHLGTWVSEARSVGLLNRDGEVLVYQVEADEVLNPFVAVYRFPLEGR